MSDASVYIETTIPSFYHEVRTVPDMVARRAWTREWWDEHRSRYDVVTSEAVIDELERGDHPVTEKASALVEDVDRLPIIPEIGEIVEVYAEHQVMPDDPVGDPLHLAVAPYHKCDFLLTWNCTHLANANKFPHTRRINTRLGLLSPLSSPLLNCLVRNSRNDRKAAPKRRSRHPSRASGAP